MLDFLKFFPKQTVHLSSFIMSEEFLQFSMTFSVSVMTYILGNLFYESPSKKFLGDMLKGHSCYTRLRYINGILLEQW